VLLSGVPSNTDRKNVSNQDATGEVDNNGS
jgi:hypothetical protein